MLTGSTGMANKCFGAAAPIISQYSSKRSFALRVVPRRGCGGLGRVRVGATAAAGGGGDGGDEAAARRVHVIEV